MRNLALKNSYFGKLEHKSLTDDIKKKALLFLIFIVMNRNKNIESSDITNGSYQ